MNKQKILAALTALVLLAGISACSKEDNNSTEEDGLPENTLVLATEAGIVPFVYQQGGAVVGVDVEIAKAVAQAMGKELVIKEMKLEEIPEAVSSGQAHFGASALAATQDRLEKVDFSHEYWVSNQVAVSRQDEEVSTAEEMEGKKVAVLSGSAAEYVVKSLADGIQQVSQPSYAAAFTALVNEEVDAVVMDKVVAEAMAPDYSGLAVSSSNLFLEKYSICAVKNDTELMNAINSVIADLESQGKIGEYVVTYSENVGA